MSRLPPRPQWNDRSVKERAAAEIFEDFAAWCTDGPLDVAHVRIAELRALLTLAVLESPDAYAAARYLDDFASLPADGTLVRLLDRAYRAMPYMTDPAIVAWVLRTGLRFRAGKGDMIRFRLGDTELTGRVVAIDRPRARGYVEMVRRKGATLRVDAEDVIENLGPAKTSRPAHRFANDGAAKDGSDDPDDPDDPDGPDAA